MSTLYKLTKNYKTKINFLEIHSHLIGHLCRVNPRKLKKERRRAVVLNLFELAAH